MGKVKSLKTYGFTMFIASCHDGDMHNACNACSMSCFDNGGPASAAHANARPARRSMCLLQDTAAVLGPRASMPQWLALLPLLLGHVVPLVGPVGPRLCGLCQCLPASPLKVQPCACTCLRAPSRSSTFQFFIEKITGSQPVMF